MKIREAIENLTGLYDAIDLAIIALEEKLHHCEYCKHSKDEDGKLVCEFVEGNEGLRINVTAPDNMPCANWVEEDENRAN